MSEFLSKRFNSLIPYVPGEQPQDKKYVKLNTNESPFPPSPRVLAAVTEEEKADLRLYSDPCVSKSRDAIASYYGLKRENVFAANGSDELLALVFMTFFDKEHSVAIPDISYGFYPVYADLFGLKAEVIPLKNDFSLDVEGFSASKNGVVIANPNAPTGIALSPTEIESILKARKNRLVVVDEAYVDFGAETCRPLLEKYENLLILQTFSKSRSLAGGRLGFALASEALIKDLELIKFSFNSYNVNRLTDLMGKCAMEDTEYFDDCRKKIIENREYITEKLKGLGFYVLPSRANFIFTEPCGLTGKEYYLRLKERGILIRYFDKPRISGFVRITIGTREQMELLFEVTKELLTGGKA